MPICQCGHLREEHGGDPKYPDGLECNLIDCDCPFFEQLVEGEEDDAA